MKKVLVLVAALALVASASAGVDLFLTKAPTPGMKAPDELNSAEKNFLASYDKFTGSPARSPFQQQPGTPTLYFLWAAGTLTGNDAFYQIYGIDLRGSGVTGGAVLDDGLFYRHSKPAPNAYKRWDAGAKISIPGLAAAVTARGIEMPANASDIANDDGGKTYALLGAVKISGDPGTFKLGLGSSTFAIRVTDTDGNVKDYDGTANNRYPGLTIQGQDAYKGPYDAVTIVPEPASVVLLALGALALRRR